MPGPNGRGLSRKHITESINASLKRLDLDYLDLYFMHFVHDEKYLEPEYIKMGERLKKSGKTRFFGFSCHDGNVVELLNKAARTASVQALDKVFCLKIDAGFLDATACNGSNRLELFVFGHDEQVVVAARLDNLGKGASGAAVQNLNVMLGLDEATGLA